MIVNVFWKVFLRILKKGLTFTLSSAIIIKQCVGTHGRICRNGGIGRRPGLKIPWDFFSYRFDPGFRHHYIAEWSSLAARRAHNPKVMRFKSHLRNQRLVFWRVFFFCLGRNGGEMEFEPLELRSMTWAFKRERRMQSGSMSAVYWRRLTASFVVSARRIADNRLSKIPSPQPTELRLPYRVSWVFCITKTTR